MSIAEQVIEDADFIEVPAEREVIVDAARQVLATGSHNLGITVEVSIRRSVERGDLGLALVVFADSLGIEL